MNTALVAGDAPPALRRQLARSLVGEGAEPAPPSLDTALWDHDLIEVAPMLFATGDPHTAREVLRHPDFEVLDARSEDPDGSLRARYPGARHAYEELVALNGEPHSLLRAPMAGRLLGSRGRGCLTIVDDVVTDVVTRAGLTFAVRGRVDAVEEIARAVSRGVVDKILDLPAAVGQVCVDNTAPISRFVADPVKRPASAEAASVAAERIHAVLAPFVEARARCRGDDLVSDFLNVSDEHPATVTRRHVVTNTALMYSAGVETSVSLIATSLWRLAEQPLLRDGLVDRAACEAFVREIELVQPPIPTLPRIARSDVEIAGRTVPAGAVVATLVGAVNRKLLAQAGGDATHVNGLAFGHGPRYCVGMHLGRREAVETVLRIVSTWPAFTGHRRGGAFALSNPDARLDLLRTL